MSDSNSGIGVLGLLGIVFVTLKLTGYIDWSWWWVTAPFWGFFALCIIVVALAYAAMLVMVVVKHLRRKLGQ